MSEGHTERLEAALDGKYRIERKLGEGGMASVYLAEDIKHERKVALKILRPELAAVIGSERFLAEIKTTAALQHPHILPLHDSGEASGYLYYVMPYIDGETLREKLDREKQLGVEEAVRIAREVADALDYAHRHGVIHRDIKPGNILLHDGRPVVADFGIALAVSAAGGGRMTETGLSLGTPHYMSPEQASADRDLSARSDVYSLGCVLYEMIGGQPPHTGPSAQSILVHILTKDVTPLAELRHTVPPHVASAVTKSIEKLPADRFESAKDFMDALGDIAFSYRTSNRPATTMPDPIVVADTSNEPRKGVIAASGAVGLAAGLVLALGWSAFVSEPVRPVTRVSVRMPEDQGFNFARGDVDLSSDGSVMVYVRAAEDARRQLWMRRFDALNATPIQDTEDARLPAISPDGREVAFHVGTRGAIRVVPLQGGVSRTVAEGSLCCPRWSPDGAWLYFGDDAGGVSRVPSAGGSPGSVLRPAGDDGNDAYGPVHVLPSGALVYHVIGNSAQFIQAFDLGSGTTKDLTAGSSPRYSSSGHLLFLSPEGTTLLAAPFDIGELELTGPAVPIAEGVMMSPAAPAFYAVSQNGRIIYRAGAADGGGFTPVWVERDGSSNEIDPGWNMGAVSGSSSLELSADGTRLAIPIPGDESALFDIWVKQLDTGPLSRITFEGNNRRVVWAPGGQSLTFISNRAGQYDVWTKRADGTGAAVVVQDTDLDLLEALYSPDGAWLVYREETGTDVDDDLYALRLGVDSAAVPVAETDFSERSPAFSPDGRWLAYTSNFTGRDEVYVVPFPPRTDSERVLVSRDGGTEPKWAHSGRELFYRNGANELVAVQVQAESSFRATQEEVLFSAVDYFVGGGHAMYDVSQDDQRFVMLRTRSEAAGTELILIDNWADELRERLGEN